jgi:hypothetical protein
VPSAPPRYANSGQRLEWSDAASVLEATPVPAPVKIEADLFTAIDEEETTVASQGLLPLFLNNPLCAPKCLLPHLHLGTLWVIWPKLLLPLALHKISCPIWKVLLMPTRTDIVLREAISVLAIKIDKLHWLTYTGLKQRSSSYMQASDNIWLIHNTLDNLRVDVDGYHNRDDTYNEHGSVWECILNLSSILQELNTLCTGASSAPDPALAHASTTEQGLDVDMEEVAKGFDALGKRLAALELGTGAPHTSV